MFAVYANISTHDGKKENVEYTIPELTAKHRHSPMKAIASFTRLSTDYNAFSMYIDCQILRLETIALPLRSLLRANQTLVSTSSTFQLITWSSVIGGT